MMAGFIPTDAECAQITDLATLRAFVGMPEPMFDSFLAHLGGPSRCREIAFIPRLTWDVAVQSWKLPPPDGQLDPGVPSAVLLGQAEAVRTTARAVLGWRCWNRSIPATHLLRPLRLRLRVELGWPRHLRSLNHRKGRGC